MFELVQSLMCVCVGGGGGGLVKYINGVCVLCCVVGGGVMQISATADEICSLS